jgi:lysophospholipase L1-like esterase
MRDTIFGWLLKLILIGVGLGGAELLVRLARVAPPLESQYIGHVANSPISFGKRPFSTVTGRSASGEFTFTYHHNSRGFRDDEHEVTKPPGVFRIVVLGDSFTYGVGATFEETYAAQLERLLNERPTAQRRVEIIKLGLPRYFPALEKTVLEHLGWNFAPDLVLVTVLPNDVIDTALGVDAVAVGGSGFLLSRYGQRFGCVGEWVYLHSHLARAVLVRATALLLSSSTELHPQDIYRNHGVHESAWRQLEADLAHMRESARQHGARFVVVSIPQGGPWQDFHAYPDQRLATWSLKHGATFIATLPALRAAEPATQLYWPKDGHCTPAGYAVIARTIFAELTAHQLVP